MLKKAALHQQKGNPQHQNGINLPATHVQTSINHSVTHVSIARKLQMVLTSLGLIQLVARHMYDLLDTWQFKVINCENVI